MTYIYLLFAVLAVMAECSSSIDTTNLFKKVGLFLLVFGSLIDVSGHPNEIFEIGTFIYLSADMWKKYKYRGSTHGKPH